MTMKNTIIKWKWEKKTTNVIIYKKKIMITREILMTEMKKLWNENKRNINDIKVW